MFFTPYWFPMTHSFSANWAVSTLRMILIWSFCLSSILLACDIAWRARSTFVPLLTICYLKRLKLLILFQSCSDCTFPVLQSNVSLSTFTLIRQRLTFLFKEPGGLPISLISQKSNMLNDKNQNWNQSFIYFKII